MTAPAVAVTSAPWVISAVFVTDTTLTVIALTPYALQLPDDPDCPPAWLFALLPLASGDCVEFVPVALVLGLLLTRLPRLLVRRLVA